MQESSLQVAIIQRFCPHYRLPLFKCLNQLNRINLTVVVNDPQILDWKKEDLGFELIYLPAFIAKFGYGAKSYNIPVSLSLIKHLWRAQYDVVVSEGVTNIINNLIIYPVSRLRGSKYIWWGAGRRRFAEKNVFRKIVDPFTHYFIKYADANIAYGSVARDYMISAGAASQKVFIAQNTIDTAPIFDTLDSFASQVNEIRQQLDLHNTKIILYVGVIEQRKKVETLILAYQKIRKQTDQPVSLVIVGDGPHLSGLKQWFEAEPELPSLNVHFTGKVLEGVGAYFTMCDVFVLPSEGGLALNQAMAYGKPVIATSADGTEVDLIQQGENGYLVEEDDIDALAEAVLQILQNPIRQQEMGVLSAQLMKEKFTMANMVQGFKSGIEASIGERN